MSKDLSDKLPARITSLLPQKKNKERYSIFIEEGFLIGVAESTLLEYKLSKGVEVTPLLFRKLTNAEGRQAAKSYCLKMLSRRDHSRKELFDKMVKKDYTRDIINSVLDEMEEKGFLDDSSFARKFASDKSRLNKWGPAKIKAHLYKKGIPKHLAEDSIETAFEDFNLEETYHKLVLKRKRKFLQEENLYKRKKKIFDYLRRKGYRSEDILKHLDKLTEAIET